MKLAKIMLKSVRQMFKKEFQVDDWVLIVYTMYVDVEAISL